MKFNVILEPAVEGGYVVTVPALDGCFTQGETIEDALENTKNAIACYLDRIGIFILFKRVLGWHGQTLFVRAWLEPEKVER